jgi:histidine ammonia-lyase
MHGPHSGLAPLLASDAPDSAGFGPLLKPAEALRAQIIHLANPVPVMASHNADGIEDSATFSALAASKLGELVTSLSLLAAFEMVAACQAVDLRSPGGTAPLAPALRPTYAAVRAICPFVDEDRPLGRQIEAVAQLVVGTHRGGGPGAADQA